MTPRVVGAGLPRTGTLSLKVALERLLGAPCYHMTELFEHPEHLPTWQRATAGGDVDWPAFLSGYAATVDWPAAMFWRRLADAFTDAVVLLSHRDSGAAWQRSMDDTIFADVRRLREMDEVPPRLAEFGAMVRGNVDVLALADDPEAAVAFHDRHLAEVRNAVPADRLVVWRPGDGWEPIAASLGVPVPDEPFPHVNDTASYQREIAEHGHPFLGEDG